jgi:hypothetical protein
MRHILWSVVLLGVVTVGAASAADRPSRGGLYDSVQISTVTGDEGGVRLQVNDGPSPTVDFTLCEGACLAPHRFPAEITGDRLSFVYVEALTDVHGRPSGEIRARVEGRFVAKGVMLKIDFLNSPHDDKEGFSLIPRARP